MVPTTNMTLRHGIVVSGRGPGDGCTAQRRYWSVRQCPAKFVRASPAPGDARAIWLTPDELAGSFRTKRGEVPPAPKHSRPRAPVRAQADLGNSSAGEAGLRSEAQPL